MEFEVEQKFTVDDLERVEVQVKALADWPAVTVEQEDLYFAHPSKDFAQTDEALRIRRVGDQAWITYKGPKVDATTKTRRELELPIGDAPAAAAFTELLFTLGFQSVAEVCKRRTTYLLTFRDQELEIALDQVDRVGRFVEIETLAEEKTIDVAREAIQKLAGQLGLQRSERRSYLELLLAREP